MTDASDDVEISDEQCPKCHQFSTVRSRYCDAIHCEDGYCDEHEDDPINFSPGEEFTVCDECWGHGVQRWCSGCGFDLSRADYLKETP